MLSFGYLTLVSVFGISCQVCGQTSLVSGTNYIRGSGFCFGDQQLKEETPFILCTPSGFNENASSYSVFWSIDGSPALNEGQVEGMYPDHIDAMNPQPGEFRLSILNVTGLGVSTVACRISAVDVNGGFVGQTPLSTPESISIVDTVPAPEMPRVTPSTTNADVTVSKPSGLCEGLRSSQITYEFKVYRNNSLVTTESVTTSGPTATANLSGLNSATEYRVEIRGIIDVINRAIPATVTFMTLGDVNECENDPGPCDHICRNTIGSYTCSCVSGYVLTGDGVTCHIQELPTTSPPLAPASPIGAIVGGVVGGVAIIIILGFLVLICIFCLKSRNSSPKDDRKKKSLKKEERSKTTAGRDVIYDDPSEADAVQMQPSPAYATTRAVRQSDLDTSNVKIEPSPAYQDWY